MILSHSAVARAGFVLSIALLAVAPAARAVTVVLHYDSPPAIAPDPPISNCAIPCASASSKDFLTAPYFEKGITTTVEAGHGHYEFVADPAPTSANDRAFNLDEQTSNPPTTELSKVTLTVFGLPFDALSLDVVNPAETAGEYTITPIGGGGGSIPIPAPTQAGTLDFSQYGTAFLGISALVIEQHSAGSFAFDELTVQSLPEPSVTASLLVSGLAVIALRRRRSV